MRSSAGFISQAATLLQHLAKQCELVYLVDRKGRPILHFDADKIVFEENVQGTRIVLPSVTLLKA
jgi:hypothetical protein